MGVQRLVLPSFKYQYCSIPVILIIIFATVLINNNCIQAFCEVESGIPSNEIGKSSDSIPVRFFVASNAIN
jgi:hypothetical protein